MEDSICFGVSQRFSPRRNLHSYYFLSTKRNKAMTSLRKLLSALSLTFTRVTCVRTAGGLLMILLCCDRPSALRWPSCFGQEITADEALTWFMSVSCLMYMHFSSVECNFWQSLASQHKISYTLEQMEYSIFRLSICGIIPSFLTCSSLSKSRIQWGT